MMSESEGKNNKFSSEKKLSFTKRVSELDYEKIILNENVCAVPKKKKRDYFYNNKGNKIKLAYKDRFAKIKQRLKLKRLLKENNLTDLMNSKDNKLNKKMRSVKNFSLMKLNKKLKFGANEINPVKALRGYNSDDGMDIRRQINDKKFVEEFEISEVSSSEHSQNIRYPKLLVKEFESENEESSYTSSKEERHKIKKVKKNKKNIIKDDRSASSEVETPYDSQNENKEKRKSRKKNKNKIETDKYSSSNDEYEENVKNIYKSKDGKKKAKQKNKINKEVESELNQSEDDIKYDNLNSKNIPKRIKNTKKNLSNDYEQFDDDEDDDDSNKIVKSPNRNKKKIKNFDEDNLYDESNNDENISIDQY